MKIRQRILLIALGIMIITNLISCKEKIKHEDEINYYVTMWTTRESQIKSWNKAIKAYNNAYNKSTWNDEGSITDGRADSVITRINIHISTIDSCQKIISGLKELDNEIGLINLMSTYLEDSRKFWDVGMKSSIENMRKGLNNLTEVEQMKMESYSEDGDKVRRQGDDLQYKIQRFAEKHKVSSDELNKYNL